VIETDRNDQRLIGAKSALRMAKLKLSSVAGTAGQGKSGHLGHSNLRGKFIYW
jgi:hypothetical protein